MQRVRASSPEGSRAGSGSSVYSGGARGTALVVTRASSCHREAQLEVGWKRWKGRTIRMRMRGDGRCNRECMHSPVSPEGRTERQAQAQGQPAQHKLWEPWNSEWIGDQGGSLAARQGCAARSGLAAAPSGLTRATGAGGLQCRNLASPARN